MFGHNSDDGNDSIENSDDDSDFIGGLYDTFHSTPEPEPAGPAPVEPNPQVNRWGLGSHTMDTGLDTDQFSDAIDRVDGVDEQLADVLREARGMMGSATLAGYECPVCGLNHSHNDTKHDIRDNYDSSPGFSVEAAFAEDMEFNPYCHCGVNELAMLIDFFGHLPQPVFRDQAAFEGVLELDTDVLIGYCQARRDLEAEAEPGERVTVVEALGRAGVGADAIDELEEEVHTFYQRWTDIKAGANGAPIANETRQAIGNLREYIEGQLAGDESEPDEAGDEVTTEELDAALDEAEELVEELDDMPELENRAINFDAEVDDDPRYEGEVVFFNATGNYGFIEVDGIDEDVFFHGAEQAIETHEGDTVSFTVEYHGTGPRADDLRHVEEDADEDDVDEGDFNFGF